MPSKYFVNEDLTTGKELWMAIIANELAEANRLKRIEIRSMFVIENGQREGTSDKIFYALDNTNSFIKELEVGA